ncbi:acetyltransferase (GNAT) family protein [Isoptericola jiangsuensis]|uniref:Acetyltransferase (GNAT) family protein n=1 Tax=Isoptericola jiangsuensis TaxID=548579 RepID=A0A2A9EXL6_9MICO|nr:GNAT family N-acetyltransferase [Isoptericola jiangsuensis]PFG43010.1 acetyltransferase (GNAT) family protein [Isoptericola jiangsuensis]
MAYRIEPATTERFDDVVTLLDPHGRVEACWCLHRRQAPGPPVGGPADWPTTWVVRCFVVRVGYRRRGVARALLRGAVEHARARGGHVVEGFPVEPEPGGRVPVGAAFVGTVPLFEAEGFENVGLTLATSGRLPRTHLRRDLRSRGAGR